MNNGKLLISIIIDNSSSMKGDKIRELKAAINQFNQDISSANMNLYFEYSLIAFEGLQAKKIKEFYHHDYPLESISEGGLAFLDKAISLGLDDLLSRLNELKQNGYQFYKPWIVLLSDGQSYENLDLVSSKLKELYQKGIISYFPFMLSNGQVDERLEELRKIKKPLTIFNEQYNQLFKWLYDTVKKRISTPIGESIKLDIDCFDGWTIK